MITVDRCRHIYLWIWSLRDGFDMDLELVSVWQEIMSTLMAVSNFRFIHFDQGHLIDKFIHSLVINWL